MLDFFMDNFYTSNELLDTKLREIEFSVIDFETTGLYPYNGDRIIEVGIVRGTPDKILKTYESFINPEILIPENVTKINKITNKMVETAPLIADKIDEMLNFMKNSVIVAHNLSFDLSFLNFQLQKMNREKVDHWLLDTIKVAKILVPGLENYKLSTVIKALNIKNKNSHRALADTEATAKALQAMIAKLDNTAILKDLNPFKIH